MENLDFVKAHVLNAIKNDLIDTAFKMYKDNIGANEKILSLEMRFNSLKNDEINMNDREFRREKTLIVEELIRLITNLNSITQIY